jgi:hypothetical protein
LIPHTAEHEWLQAVDDYYSLSTPLSETIEDLCNLLL